SADPQLGAPGFCGIDLHPAPLDRRVGETADRARTGRRGCGRRADGEIPRRDFALGGVRLRSRQRESHAVRGGSPAHHHRREDPPRPAAGTDDIREPAQPRIRGATEMSEILALDGIAPRLAADAWIAPGARVMGRVTLAAGASVWFNAVLRGDHDPILV